MGNMKKPKAKSLDRRRRRQLATELNIGEAEILKESHKQKEEQIKSYYKKSLFYRLRHFYNLGLPTRLAKRVFWFTLIFIIPMIPFYALIRALRLQLAWKWAKEICHTISK